MKILYTSLLLLFLILGVVGLDAATRLPQMSDSCSDGKIIAIDVTNNRYKCIIVPVVVDTVNVNLTGQTAAIGSTLLYNVPVSATGLYRVTWTATVTRAASVSSVLGGTGLGLQVTYTNGDDSTAVTTMAGLTGAVNLANIVGSPASGVVVIYAKASTTINYQIGYTSVGSPTMQFSLHVRLEALQ